ncbi:MAG: flagellar basal-body rod protein FlgG [Armatimonadetes bacterium]|nr:flagellar basal-body rod protein FlgG [Armatimonadota bacterium]
MMRSVYTAASGMSTQQHHIDTIANNLANSNTTGFKKSRMEFQDLMYDTARPAGATLATGGTVPLGTQTGLGAKTAATQRIMSQGVFQQTGGQLDVAIEGDGYFQIQLPDGSLAYTRDGAFKRDAQGQLVTTDGYILSPQITIPQDATNIVVGTDGKVSVFLQGQTTPTDAGQITLARFPNQVGLTSKGRNLYAESPASGTPVTGNPTTTGLGSLSQGFLEMSNVQVVDEMVNMITAQRAYEINARVIQGADHMLGIVAQLKQ